VLPPSGGEDTTVTFAPIEVTGEGADEDVTVTLDDLPESVGMLVVKRGPNAGSKFVLDSDVTRAGRHPDSDIFLDDITVSRRHAEIVRDGGGYRVRDVGSLNGTYVNRERIDEAPIANGDELQVGKFKLVFFAGTAGEG
jgi:pSer/pThr/pTyr-binding forkhead associated (FHA) protein